MARIRFQAKRYEMAEEHYRSIVKVQNSQNISPQNIEYETPTRKTEANSSIENNTCSNQNNIQQSSFGQHELLHSKSKYENRKRQSIEIENDVIEKKKQLIGMFSYYLNYNTNDYQKCTVLNYNSNIKKFRIVTANKTTMHVSPNVLCSQSEFTEFFQS